MEHTILVVSHACRVMNVTVQCKQAVQWLYVLKCDVWKVYLSPSTLLSIARELKFPASDNDYLNKKKVIVQSRLKIAKNPNFDSTSNRRAAPSAPTKTKLLVWLKGKISIQFDDQLCNCAHQGFRSVDHDVWFAVQDGSNFFWPVLSTCSLYSIMHFCFASIKSGRCLIGPSSPLFSKKPSRNSYIDFFLLV